MIQDYAFAIAMIFVISIAILVSYIAADNINTVVQNNTQFNAQSKSVMGDFTTRYPQVMDYTLLVIYIAVIIGMIVLSYPLQTNAGLYFVIVVGLMIVGSFGGFLANSWETLKDDLILEATISHFPITDFMISHYLIFTLLAGFLCMIAFFAKPSEVSI